MSSLSKIFPIAGSKKKKNPIQNILQGLAMLTGRSAHGRGKKRRVSQKRQAPGSLSPTTMPLNAFADRIEFPYRTAPVPDIQPQTAARTARRKLFSNAVASEFQIKSDADRERAFQEAAKEADNIRSRAAPKTLMKNQRIKECWIDYIHVFRSEDLPRLSNEEVWKPELVEAQMFGFLATMASGLFISFCFCTHVIRLKPRLPARGLTRSMPAPS